MSSKKITKDINFSKRLKSFIKDELGITQAEFADKMGITQGYLNMVLGTKNRPPSRGPSAELMAGLFIHYREYLDWLLTGQGPMRRGREAPAAEEPVQPYTTTNEKHAEVFALVREILESGDDLIIRSFHERLKDYRIALRRNDETRSLKQQLGSLERKFKALEQRIGPPMEAGASADADAEAVGAADAGSEKKAI
ncbi:MAG: helix-turn-helix transcriptional regulator [Syntrophaceae bacterium]|nr:helix-turn-helix transcriptional regulator [Syntrophaceae bacterium]